MLKYKGTLIAVILICIAAFSGACLQKCYMNKKSKSAQINQNIDLLQEINQLKDIVNKSIAYKPCEVNLFKDAINKFKILTNGVIHIGASQGQEEALYTELNFKNILWIEADPEMAAALENKLGKKTGMRVASFAASDQNGEADFMRTNNQQSSSLFDLDAHSRIHKDVVATEKIKVKTKKLDDFLKEIPEAKEYNVLTLDTQGAELLVVRGAVDTLKHIDIIFSEISYVTLYKDSVIVYQLDSFLLEQGFIRADTVSVVYAWGDAIYVKKSIIDNMVGK